MRLILFDTPETRNGLLPLTLTRPVSEIRVGILTLAQKWEKHLGTKASFYTADYLSEKYPLQTATDNIWINGALCPDNEMITAIGKLPPNSCLTQDGHTLAIRCDRPTPHIPKCSSTTTYPHKVALVDRPWKIVEHNAAQLKADYAILTKGRKSERLNDPHTVLYGTVGENIFIEKGTSIKASILNAERGPIYLGPHTEVQEGSSIRGPFALCEGGQLSMGTNIRGDSTVGPYAKVGGEVSASVLLGFSNKSHDGFLGHSVIGEWCNLGAGSNTSNLKNNYGEVSLWDDIKKEWSATGRQFLGLIMGDHSKCSINTMFNTGTAVGVGCHVFGSGFPKRWIPSFTWGGVHDHTLYRLEDLLDTAEKMMRRRMRTLSESDRRILTHLFEATTSQ